MSRNHHDAFFRCCVGGPERADDWLFPLFPELREGLLCRSDPRPASRRKGRRAKKGEPLVGGLAGVNVGDGARRVGGGMGRDIGEGTPAIGFATD